MLYVHHIFANSSNFLIIWELSVTIFHSKCKFCVHSMAMYSTTLQFYVSMYVSFVCRYVAPLVSVITTLNYTMLHVCRLFHWIAQTIFNKLKDRASSSSPRLPLCLNFVSFVASIAALARGEKSRTQALTHSINHPSYLLPGNWSLHFGTEAVTEKFVRTATEKLQCKFKVKLKKVCSRNHTLQCLKLAISQHLRLRK